MNLHNVVRSKVRGILKVYAGIMRGVMIVACAAAFFGGYYIGYTRGWNEARMAQEDSNVGRTD